MKRFINKNDWNSATSTRNYFVEPLLDWFKYTQPKKSNTGHKFNTYIADQGIQFEKQIIKLIYKKFNKHHIFDVNGLLMPKDEDKYADTLAALKKGYHIILNGVIHNYKNNTFGVPDIIIRSDKLNKLVNNKVIDDDEGRQSSKITKNYHYRIIDIKFLTLTLKADGKSLLNGGMLPAYKAQLNIYNLGIGQMQGFTPDKAYILGRRTIYTNNGKKIIDNDSFGRLGVIDYTQDDEKYVGLTNKALK